MENKKVTINDLPRIVWVKYSAQNGYPEECIGYQLDLLAVWMSDAWYLNYCDGTNGYMETVLHWTGKDIEKLVSSAKKWFDAHPTGKHDDGNPEYLVDDISPFTDTTQFEVE